jgi:hypothetical protein
VQIDIGDLGVSLALGAFLFLSIGLVIEICSPDRLLKYARSEHIPKHMYYAFFLALLVIAGLVSKDVSDLMDDKWESLLSPLPSEKQLRAEVFFDDDLLRSLYARSSYVQERLVELGVAPEHLEAIKAKPLGKSFPDVGSIYYTAKNEVFRNDNYYDELRAYQFRIDFARAFSFSSLIVLVVTLISFSSLPSRPPALRRQIAKRLLVLAIFFLCGYWIGRLAYTAEEREFDKRVYGYFVHEATACKVP